VSGLSRFWRFTLVATMMAALVVAERYPHAATLIAAYTLMGLGYQLIFGHLGALALSQGAMFGVGAYATALLASTLGVGVIPVGALIAALVAAVVAVPVLRLQSHYFALATIALAAIVHLVAVNAERWTGGANGLVGFGTNLPSELSLALVAWTVAALFVAALARAMAGRWAETARLLREAPLAAEALGIDGARWRFTAFVCGSALGGLGGGIAAAAAGVVSPEATGFPLMVLCLVSVVVGGARHPMGAVLGAVLAVLLPELLRDFGGAWLLAYAIATLIVVRLAPEGLAAAIDRWRGAAQPMPPLDPLPRRPVTAKRRLAVRDAVKRFGGVEAVAGVSFEVARGEVVGLIGPNGSGKTTILNLISGLVPADEGAILLDDQALDGLGAVPRARAGLARSFQTPALPAATLAGDAVGLVAWGDAPAALAMFGLDKVAAEPCGRLAPGERRRVDLARAVATGAPFLLLDEPAAGLGDAEREVLVAALRALAAEDRAVLVIDHDIALLSRACDRLICLDRGRVIASGTPDAVRADRRVQAAYLGRAA